MQTRWQLFLYNAMILAAAQQAVATELISAPKKGAVPEWHEDSTTAENFCCAFLIV